MIEAIDVPFPLVAIGVTFGGLSGTLHGVRKRMDLFGALFVGVMTALGAATVRDITLARVPSWLYSPLVGYAILGGIGGYLLGRTFSYMNRTIFYLDTMMIGVWVVFGCELALIYGQSAVSAVAVGVFTSVGGGLIRDVLCRDTPTAFSPTHFDAATGFLASVVFVTTSAIFPSVFVPEVLTIGFGAVLRFVAVRKRWRTPSAVELSERLRGRESIYDPATGVLERISRSS